MITQIDLVSLISEARDLGAIIRTKGSSHGDIEAVSIGKLPDGKYRRLGEPGAQWMPPVQAAELLRDLIRIEKED